MGFRNPLTSLPASAITSGTFGGDYVNAGNFTLAGDPAHSHVQASATALVFYAADGVTPLITMDTASGAGAINSATITGGTIVGATIETAAAGQRWVLDPNGLHAFSGLAGEVAPAALSAAAAAGIALTSIYGPDEGHGYPGIEMQTGNGGAAAPSLYLGAWNGRIPDTTAEITLAGATQVLGALTDDNNHPYPQWATSTQRTLDAFGASGNTDGTGHLTIGHSLGVAPVSLLVIPLGTNVTSFRVTAVSAANFTVQAMNGTATVNSTPVFYYYLAIG